MLSFDLAGREAGRASSRRPGWPSWPPRSARWRRWCPIPASTTHRQFAPDALAAAGIGEGMVRVSVGLEDGADLVEDFTRALEVA